MKSSVITVLFLYFGSMHANSINDKECGVVASDNPIHQHPWLVFMEYHYGGRRALLRCGGTLIDSRHILTSAHCVEIDESFPGWWRSVTILPRLGEYNLSSRRDCVAGICSDPVVRMLVKKIFVQPLFYRDYVSHDLAMLVLETEAPYTDFIRPVCLPRRASGIPTELYASGFGETPNSDQPSQIKKNIRLPYYPRCSRAYEQNYNLPKDGFCAGGEENIDTCNGDSGGPIIWEKEDGGLKRAELLGVIKGGTKRCGLKGKPGVYTSVSKNLLWIRKVIKITSPEQQNNETQTEEKKSEENENGVQQNEENTNGDKQTEEKHNENKNGSGEKLNEVKPNEESQNGDKQDKGKHDIGNSGEIRSGSGYLLIVMLVLNLLWLFYKTCFS